MRSGSSREPAERERRVLPLARAPQPVPPPAWLFPDPSDADEDGVVGVGADLRPPTLVHAYREGIFPWPHPGMPLPWFSPDPRGVLDPGDVHVGRTLRRRLRRCGWATTVDASFGDVVEGCAQRGDDEGTWITHDMRVAYARLHALGWAHSIEVWDGDRLVGGLYGVQVGGCFTGESMFHREDDASKVALLDLARRFEEAGGTMVDVQIVTDHLARSGARAVPREDFLARLRDVRDASVRLRTDERPAQRLAGSGY